jgi:hypothetical protein
MPKFQKPGETPKDTGEYLEVGSKGGVIKNARQVTIDSKDNHLPPTQKKGNKWKLTNRKRK